MNILITGSTSTIGKSIVRELAPNNSLFIIYRNSAKDELLKIKDKMLSLGSNKVKLIEKDLGDLINGNSGEIFDNDFDIYINVLNSTSNLIDEQILPDNHQYYTNVDLTNPLIIAQNILDEKIRKGIRSNLTMVFISTILTKINNQNHNIYTSYKMLQTEYIKQIKNNYNDHFDYLFVYVGSRINRKKESKKSRKIARSLKYALNKGKTSIIIGFEGKILFAAHLIHPLLCKILIYVGRFFKNTN